VTTLQVPNSEKEQVRMLSNCPDTATEDFLRPCVPSDKFKDSNSSYLPTCVRLTSPLFPKAVWGRHDNLSTLVKLAAYGKYVYLLNFFLKLMCGFV
jgi:hypothetical protein